MIALLITRTQLTQDRDSLAGQGSERLAIHAGRGAQGQLSQNILRIFGIFQPETRTEGYSNDEAGQESG